RATWHKDGSGKLHVEEHPIQEHRWGKKRIPSGFFNQPETENVSAILFSNAATISKFDRMGKLAGFGEPDVKLLRVGTKLNPDPDATEPIAFCVEIEPGMYSESWTEGIQIYHNPRALLPIPPELFAGCAHHSMRDGRRIHIIPDSFVYSSNTIILAAKENSTDEHGHRQSNQPDKKSNAD
ncbi:MAG TPA: hypothetical protein VMA13_05220, partial [Candidatus Saccharimonadales bacterium]|nr:hypothetical protein [Candidatus Saccharimonadales bacterium]